MSFSLVLVLLPELHDAYSFHSVSASPVGGTYSTTQSVTLESSDPAATIYYSTDGTDPTTNSTQYNGTVIGISTNTTLKFFAVDLLNHTSAVSTELYVFVLPPPTVIAVEPEDGARRVDVLSVINATFSRPMDGNTINTDTFLVVDEFGSSPFGSVTYDSLTNTASFSPDSPLEFGLEYTATL
ncbi:MAG: chitobiase/beta-hexosaminidase C-terminal domain-containing protein, partial [Nitrososphaerales archaeon]